MSAVEVQQVFDEIWSSADLQLDLLVVLEKARITAGVAPLSDDDMAALFAKLGELVTGAHVLGDPDKGLVLNRNRVRS